MWSPEQICKRLQVDFPKCEAMRISQEAICQTLFIQGRSVSIRVDRLSEHRPAKRVPRARTQGRGKKFVTPEVMISERPAVPDERAVHRRWKGDLVLHEALFDRAMMKGQPRRDVRRIPAESEGNLTLESQVKVRVPLTTRD